MAGRHWRIIVPWTITALVLCAWGWQQGAAWYENHQAYVLLKGKLPGDMGSGVHNVTCRETQLARVYEWENQLNYEQVRKPVMAIDCGENGAVYIEWDGVKGKWSSINVYAGPTPIKLWPDQLSVVTVAARDGRFPGSLGMTAMTGPEKGKGFMDTHFAGVYDAKLVIGNGKTETAVRRFLKNPATGAWEEVRSPKEEPAASATKAEN